MILILLFSYLYLSSLSNTTSILCIFSRCVNLPFLKILYGLCMIDKPVLSTQYMFCLCFKVTLSRRRDVKEPIYISVIRMIKESSSIQCDG